MDELAWDRVDHHDLYTVYSAMGYEMPSNLRSQLVNARQRDKYFGGVVDGKTQLSHAGETFGRHKSIDAQEDE